MARRRETAHTGPELPMLPVTLRRRPDRAGDLPVWREARREWEAEHGMTVTALWAAELEAVRSEGSLMRLNALYGERLIEPEDDDPRPVSP